MRYILATVGLFALAIGMSYAYAYQETVDLPRSDYIQKTCTALIIGGQSIWEWNCIWKFEESNPAIAADGTGVIIPIPDTDNPFEALLRQINIEFDEEIIFDTEADDSTEIDEPEATPFEELDPEVRKALDKLGKCQFGDGVWSGIVANYTREVPSELPIFTSGLDKRPLLGKLAKAFEECKGKTNYPWLSQQYEDVYLADLLGLDRFNRPELSFGLDERRLYEEQRTASQEEKDSEAATSKDYMCRAENLHLKLCAAYMELQGENRGNPEPIISDMDEYNRYLSARAGSILTDQDFTNLMDDLKQLMCDEYTERYQYKIRTYIENGKTITDYSNYPAWLLHCHE